MTKRILKYTVPVSDHPYTLLMDQQIVHVGQQSNPDELVLWAIEDTSVPTQTRTFCVVGTGHVWPADRPFITLGVEFVEGVDTWQYVATVEAYHGLVWHLLELVTV